MDKEIKIRLIGFFLVLGFFLNQGLALAASGNLEYFDSLGKDKNLIVVQADGLANFILARDYKGMEISPNLNRLIASKGSIFYNNYYELSDQSGGAGSEFTSLTSFYPSLEGISYEDYKGKIETSLAYDLAKLGYTTSLVTDSSGYLWNRLNTYKDLGFNNFYPGEDFDLAYKDGILEGNGYILSQLIGRLDKDEKFFTYISLSHNQPRDRREGSKDFLEDYLLAINELDRNLGIFIEGLKQAGLDKNTVLVIQGGSPVVPVGNWDGKDRLEDLIGGEYEYSTMVNIPMVIKLPDYEANRQVDNLGSQLDFYPTMASIMGIDKNPNIFGIDISREDKYRPIPLSSHRTRGSFTDGENVFLMSSTGDFNRSRGYKVNGDTRLALDNFFDIYRRLMEDLERSDSYLRKEEDRLDLVDIEGQVGEVANLYRLGYRRFLSNLTRDFLSLDLEGMEKYYKVSLKDLDYLESYRDKSINLVIDDEASYKDIEKLGYKNISLDASGKSGGFLRDYPMVILDRDNITSFKRRGKKYLERSGVDLTRNFFTYGESGYLLNPRTIYRRQEEKKIKNKHIVAHAGGFLGGKTYTNSLDALENSYKQGIRLMEVDFQWTRDDRLVCLHSWDGFVKGFFNVPVGQYTYQEFLDFKMINGWQQLYPDLLESWVITHPDAYIVTDVKENNLKALETLARENPRLANRLIPQVYNFEEYKAVSAMGYEDIILTLYLIKEDNKEILHFAKENKPFGVTMPLWRVGTGLAKDLEEEGIFTYTHTVNKMEDLKDIESKGIRGIYTDKILLDSIRPRD